MRNRKKKNNPAIGIGIAAIVAVLCLAALASDSARIEKPAAVDAEQYAELIENEVFDIQDLAEGAEIQRRRFNRMTPPGFSWVQPMFPSVVPFDADNFDEKFLDELLGEDKNSVAIYPLSLTQDPKTRETLVFNAEGKQIATIPADRVSREWPEDADPARVTLLLDLLPAEDVEPYLYTESRIEESLSQRERPGRVTPGGAIAKSLGAGEFGICGIRKTTNGTMLITVTNGLDAAEIYAYTVAHTSSVVGTTWTNEYDEVITSTNVIWHPVSPPFNGIQSDWASRVTNLVLTGGTGVWEDTNISSNDRVRFYAAAKRGDQDGDGLSDGSEILLHRTNLQSLDTDGDGLLDGCDITVQMGDPRYSLWANQGILYSESTGMRLFRGELSAGSDPLDDDTDGDGLPDGWEVQNDLDPLDAEGDDGPEGDPDADGFDNALERELGAPANNAAWNGNELAYRLMHATPVVVTNTRSIITNLVGMRVTVEDSWDCVTGGNPGRQNEVATLEVRDLLECGYYVDIEIEGSVEDVDDGYDMVYFEAHSNNFYFSSHDGIPDGVKEECVMINEYAEKNNLILANSTVVLRYNTVGYRWHSGAYAEIIHATNTGPYKVVVSGEDVICVGETTQMEAAGAAGAPYTWSANGDISVSTNGEVTGLAPGLATVIVTDAGGCSGEKEINIINVELDTVSSADFIGDDSGTKVYASAQGSGNVTIQLKTSPSGVSLPSGFVSWSGGASGSDQLQRIISKSALIEAGETVTATACGNDVFNGKVYVFKGTPSASGVDIDVTVTRDDSIASPFGVTARGEAWSPSETYDIYYENKKWKFVFEEVAYEIKWGINNGGRTDVPDGTASPFPLGMGMDPASTEAQKKTQAKSDLTPDATGRAPRTRYWSSALTSQHELFHVSDWRDSYYTPKAQEAETWIESQEEGVTLSNLSPSAVLTAKESDFHDKLIEKTDEAQAAYNPDKETRAYGDGKDEYQALADSIVP